MTPMERNSKVIFLSNASSDDNDMTAFIWTSLSAGLSFYLLSTVNGNDLLRTNLH